MFRGAGDTRSGWPVVAVALCVAACGSPPVTPTPTLTIVCPANVSARAPIGATAASVVFAEPTASGGSGGITTSCTPPSGSAFPVGSSSVSCVAADTAGHGAFCSFAVAVAPPPIPLLSLTSFMAYGDSLTEGKTSLLPSMVFDTSYTLKLAAMLTARYTTQTITVVNEGQGGETTAEALASGRFDRALASDRPQVLLLMDGANDINGGDSSSVTPAVNGLDTMGSRATARGVRVFIATLPPEDPSKKNGSGAALVPQLNARIASLAGARGWTLVDVYAAFNGNLSLLGSDGLHPVDAGHQVIAQTFYDRIVATLETVPTSGAPR